MPQNFYQHIENSNFNSYTQEESLISLIDYLYARLQENKEDEYKRTLQIYQYDILLCMIQKLKKETPQIQYLQENSLNPKIKPTKKTKSVTQKEFRLAGGESGQLKLADIENGNQLNPLKIVTLIESQIHGVDGLSDNFLHSQFE